MTPLDTTTARLAELLAKATAGDLLTAARVTKSEYVECPMCDGNGELAATDFCNFDGVAIGVQFYGIGPEFGTHQELWEASLKALPTLLSTIASQAAEIERLRGENDELRSILAEAVPIIDQIKADVLRPPSRDSQDRRVERAARWLVKGARFLPNGDSHD